MLVLGEKEQQAGMVAVRHRTEGDKGQMPLDSFIERAKSEVANKTLATGVAIS